MSIKGLTFAFSVFFSLRWSFNPKSPFKNGLFQIWSLFTQIGTYGAQNNHKAAPRWMYHNHFHPCTTTMRHWPTTLLHYIHNVEANTCKYNPEQPSSSISGGSLSLMTLMRSPLPACNFQSLSRAQVIIYSQKKITLMTRGNNYLQLSFNGVSKTRSWSFMHEKKR